MYKSLDTRPRLRSLLGASLLIGCAASALADDAGVLAPDSAGQATGLLIQSAQAGAGPAARLEVQLGAPDPRLRLAPCERTEAYLPAGQRAIGRTRVGLRCLQGATLWNITLPARVLVWAPGQVAAGPLPAGTRLEAQHLQSAEIDWGADGGAAFVSAAALLGRELARPLAAGTALRAGDLRQRQWFSAGETVQVFARGPGYAVSGEAEALSHGIEGQPARVRTPSGRILSGRPAGDRTVEIGL